MTVTCVFVLCVHVQEILLLLSMAVLRQLQLQRHLLPAAHQLLALLLPLRCPHCQLLRLMQPHQLQLAQQQLPRLQHRWQKAQQQLHHLTSSAASLPQLTLSRLH